jgi:hypothetical protein
MNLRKYFVSVNNIGKSQKYMVDLLLVEIKQNFLLN